VSASAIVALVGCDDPQRLWPRHDEELLPALSALPGVTETREYVATPWLRAMHRPTLQQAFGLQTNAIMSLVLIDEKAGPERGRDVAETMRRYHADHALAWLEAFDVRWTIGPDTRGAEVTGVQLSLGEVVDPSWRDEVDRWYREIHAPDTLTVPGTVTATLLRSAEARRQGRNLVIFTLDDDPRTVVAGIGARLPVWRSAGRTPSPGRASQPLFTGPMAVRRVVP
jgi:hypothetical protein